MQIPGYQIERELGRGAMASVYLAMQLSLDRRVALKVMAPSLSSDPTFCERFIKEGRIVAKLAHPHVVTIYDIAQSGEHYYMAMEYLGAGTLAERLGQPMLPRPAVAIVKQVAMALNYAHRHGFVHRDVKPANILFRDDGTAVLSDFGIAKALDNRTQMTAAGSIVGTPSYMSPEQALGKPADHRSDLYSLGVVFFEMLTGHKPFQADDMFATALMHVNAPIPRLPDAAREFQSIVDALMAKDPAARFQSADGLVQALAMDPAEATRVLATMVAQPTVADTVVLTDKTRGAATQPAHTKGLRPAWLWPVAATAVVSLAGVGYWGWQSYNSPDNATSASISTEDTTHKTRNDSLAKPPVVLDPATLERIVRMLKAAEAHMLVGRLVDPAGSNAYEAYREILLLDPTNEQAEQGIQAIADYFQEKAQALLAEGKTTEALEQVKLGLQVMPEHVGLKQLSKVSAP